MGFGGLPAPQTPKSRVAGQFRWKAGAGPLWRLEPPEGFTPLILGLKMKQLASLLLVS